VVSISIVRKLLVSGIVVPAALALAGAAWAARVPPQPQLPPGWSHAEINVIVRGAPHTLVYDRGRVQAVSASSITLRERDGSSVTINVASTSRVTIDGSPASLSQVRRFELATTLQIDGAPATRVTVQIPPGLAAAIASGRAGTP
jgi:hypothetical protein